MGRSLSGTDAHFNGFIQETPEHPVTVSSFSLDKFEVTIGRFRRFVEAYPSNRPAEGAGAHPIIPGTGWQSAWDAMLPPDQATLRERLNCSYTFPIWTDVPGGRETLPMHCMTWFEAFAFCAWDGGRLPTEAEWEFAAAGGDENRLYPWGSDGDAVPELWECCGDGLCVNCSPDDILPVGSVPRGNGRFGHAELGGSLMEWALDWDDEFWYSDPGASGIDVANLTPSTGRIQRGGAFSSGSIDRLRAAMRYSADPASRSQTGVRCARTP